MTRVSGWENSVTEESLNVPLSLPECWGCSSPQGEPPHHGPALTCSIRSRSSFLQSHRVRARLNDLQSQV